MERFIIQHSQAQPDGWVCTDKENGIVCRFTAHQFNETQQFTMLDDVECPDAQTLARMVREMADWLRFNHYDKVMPPLDRDGHRIRIGQEIAALRRQQGKTQQDIADHADIQRNHLSRIEAGKYSVGFDTLQAIADALDADIRIVPRQ